MNFLTQTLTIALERLLTNPTPAKLAFFSATFSKIVPFNISMGAKLLALDELTIECSLPNKRRNHNHLGSIHACAIATLGEMSAGILLLKSFPLSRYRIILKELKVNYHYQARLDLHATAKLGATTQERIKKSLNTEGIAVQKIKTVIHDTAGNHIADISSTWQLKTWTKVHVK